MNIESSRTSKTIEHFKKALDALGKSTELPITEPRDLSGIIKDFELVYEIAWKALKKSLEQHGHETGSAREAFATAYQLRWLHNESVWIEMIRDRNLTVHTYNKELAKEMSDRIRQTYVSEFGALFEKLLGLSTSK